MRRVSKHPQAGRTQQGRPKSPCRKLFPKFRQKFEVSFSSPFFVLSRFRVFFSDGSSKTPQKTFCKKIVSKSFYRKFDQKSKTNFFSIFSLTFLGVPRYKLSVFGFYPPRPKSQFLRGCVLDGLPCLFDFAVTPVRVGVPLCV
jgi:hypothetical protein